MNYRSNRPMGHQHPSGLQHPAAVPQPAQREVIVDKLQEALAAFRRERDDLHRKKELAMERFRLAKEARQDIEQKIKQMDAKLAELKESAAGNNDGGNNAILKLQQEVERLGREATFQHAELVGKKEKLNQITKCMGEESKSRAISLRLAREDVRGRREKAANRTHTGDITTITGKEVEKVQQLMVSFDDQDLLSRWPRIVEQRATAIALLAGDTHRKSEVLTRRITGYKKLLEGTIDPV